ncbi:Nucleotidyltransferase [uncultured Candidatus Thioglobus sp.]|nr:Nucleotidyltransferase [uncultured Candidatus Thioglobus sp.]SMN00663.1 Nucleotidyltransferase [uncultured Candidatus Thioglobus sp.]
MSENRDIRWKQRFQNYSKAFSLLRVVIEENENILTLSDLEKEGFVKRFEFTLELAWKTLKDKMQEDGIILDKISPKSIVKLAYNRKYIDNIDTWIAMINDRNLMSHTYNFIDFNKILEAIQQYYYQELDKLHLYFIEEDLNS